MKKSYQEGRPTSGLRTDRTVGDEEKLAATAGTRRKHFFRRCCCFSAALLFAEITVSLILMLTLFRPRDAAFKLNKLTVVKIDLINGTKTPIPGTNATIDADISVKNPNYVSLKHQSTTMTIYYGGIVVGDLYTPAGTEKARRTTRMNVTAEVIMDRLLSVPDLKSDMKSGVFTSSGYTRFGATMKFFFVKMHVKLQMNCTTTLNVTSLEILHAHCQKKVKLF